MKLPSLLLAKIIGRFDSLIAEGEEILQTAKHIAAEFSEYWVTGRTYESRAAHRELDWPRFVKWRTNAATLLDHVLPKDHIHYPIVKSLPNLGCSEDRLTAAVSVLKGVKNDLEEGFLDSLCDRVETEIASDYMGQAERLMKEGQSGKFDHVPAAVLAGAVLEKALRVLCGQQTPPVPITTSKGEPKTMNPLIDDLKKAGLFNELKAKQLRGWADIRNKAAHGEFDQFTKADVENMISGITNFLADYLG